MRARPANLGDVAAVGVLICDALPLAPSSLYGRLDLPEDEVEIGREVLASSLAGGELAWVLETGDQIAGVAITRRRSLARAGHVGDLEVLVHPHARERGGGRILLQAIVQAAREASDLHKLAVRIASDDEALRRTLKSSGAAWACERVEVGALRRGAAVLDVQVWGLVVGYGPVPDGLG